MTQNLGNNPLNQFLDDLLILGGCEENAPESEKKQLEREDESSIINTNIKEIRNIPFFNNNSDIKVKKSKYII